MDKLPRRVPADIELPIVDISDVERELIDEHGNLRLKPAQYFHDMDRTKFLNFMHRHALYVMPTVELIDWLNTVIIGHAVEIGAGNGAIARHLGIVATDSYQQETAERKFLYALNGVPTVKYGKDVVKLDAEGTIDLMKPDTVIGAFITHKCWDFMPVVARCGNADGVEEEYVILKTQRYIMIGNDYIHDNKPALKIAHDKLTFPWLVTRASKPELNCIYMWTKKQPN